MTEEKNEYSRSIEQRQEENFEIGEPVFVDGNKAGVNGSDGGRKKREQAYKNKNIFFVGMTGVGKTSVGWSLSKEIGLGFLDLDEWVEDKHEKSIADIFDDEGEQAFRLIEHQAVKQLVGIQNHIISLGGGTVMNDKNWNLIKESGCTVWIQGNADHVAKRLSSDVEALDQRPLLSHFSSIENAEERYNRVKQEVSDLLEKRSERYGECDFKIDLSHASVDSSVKQVKELLRSSGVLN